MPQGIRKYRSDLLMVNPLLSSGPDGGGGGGGVKTDEKSDDATDSKDMGGESGEDWQSRFESQQKVNRDLEGKLNTLRDGLKSALGINDKKVDQEHLLAGLQKQFADLQHQNLVEQVARRHGLTNEDDVAFLASATDADAMDKLAARLAPKGDDSANASGKPGAVKPDPSQGKGGDRKATASVAAGRDLWDEMHPTKK